MCHCRAFPGKLFPDHTTRKKPAVRINTKNSPLEFGQWKENTHEIVLKYTDQYLGEN